MIWFVPSALMFAFSIIDYFLVRNTPSECGLDDIDTGDGSVKGDTRVSQNHLVALQGKAF